MHFRGGRGAGYTGTEVTAQGQLLDVDKPRAKTRTSELDASVSPVSVRPRFSSRVGVVSDCLEMYDRLAPALRPGRARSGLASGVG